MDHASGTRHVRRRSCRQGDSSSHQRAARATHPTAQHTEGYDLSGRLPASDRSCDRPAYHHSATMRRLLETRIGRALRSWPSRQRPAYARRFVFHYDHVLGTSLELQLVADRESDARRAEREVLAEVDRLEPILSGWSCTSELARWLETHDVDVPVSRELADVLDASDVWRRRTGGAFDPAAQAVIERLRDGTDHGPGRNVSPASLD